jgi:hypothetical protein
MTVEVRETLTGKVLLWHQGQALTLKATDKPERKAKTATKKAGSTQPRKPAADHPWRMYRIKNQFKNSTQSTTVQAT